LPRSTEPTDLVAEPRPFTLEVLQRTRSSQGQLQYLIDVQAIRDVLALYCRAQDRCDLELLQSVFHEDAMDHHGGVFEGSVRDFCGFAIDKLRQCEVVTHHLCQTLIDVDGDTASSEAYAIAFHRIRVGTDTGTVDSIWSGRILDRFERRAGLWKIARRQVAYDWNIDTATRETWSMGFFPPPHGVTAE
jgi:hypothetical protein